METSRERVLNAVNHIEPESTPVRLSGIANPTPWFQRFGVTNYFALCDRLGLDFAEANPVYQGSNVEKGLSIWGNKYDYAYSDGSGYSSQREDYPLSNAVSLDQVERYSWPTSSEFDYQSPAEVLRSEPNKARMIKAVYVTRIASLANEDLVRGNTPADGKKAGFDWIPLLCTLFNLFGFENTLLRLHTEPKIIECAISHIEEFTTELCRRMLEATRGLADFVWYGDDFSTQKGILISPEHWRKYLKPTYRRLFDLFKSYDMKIWFHSCGTFAQVLPDLIEIGMDVWETVQAHLIGNEPVRLKREYGKDIVFYGAINTQETLPFGTAQDVRREVRERISVLGKEGGYICGGDHGILPDIPIENVLAMIDEARRYSRSTR